MNHLRKHFASWILAIVAFAVLTDWLADPRHSAMAQSGFQGTSSETAYNAATTTGPTSFFRNIGQASHWLHYCHTGAGAHTVQLEGSDDNVVWYGISLPATSTSGSPCGVIESGGYYNYVRADVTSITGGSISAVYSSSTAAIPGGGLVQANRTSQLVTFKPVSVLSSTSYGTVPSVQVASCCFAVYSFSAVNPTGAAIFCGLSTASSGMPTGGVLIVVPANGYAAATVPSNGIDFTGGSFYAGCSTDLAATAAPASPAAVFIGYKPTLTVLGKGNSSGAQTNTQQAYQ